jgi:hypothetical protein
MPTTLGRVIAIPAGLVLFVCGNRNTLPNPASNTA